LNIVEIKNVNYSYGKNKILENLNLNLEKGKFYTLLGPSGCGKSTILNIIGGFIEPDDGSVKINNVESNNIPANKRPVNTVFQNYALFEHLNIFENIAFGLRIKKLPENEIKQEVEKYLKIVDLEGYGNRKVDNLSGGQKQRVAIARALVNQPEILLLDEPLSALDLKLRTEMQAELRYIQQQTGITFVFVTHDQEEALAMSDEIIVLNKGKIIQQGTPVAIYDEPVNKYVADFIGEANIIDGKMVDDYKVEFNSHLFDCVDKGFEKNERIGVVIRPEDVEVTLENAGYLNVTIDSILFRGVHYELICIDQFENQWLVHTTKKVHEDEIIGIKFDPDAIHVMKEDINE
jgi:spermidine/putrescine transport system ATP-binding protein